MTNERQSIFSKYAKNIVPVLTPMHDRPEISQICDILGRQQRHHVILSHPSSLKLRQCIQETLAYTFNTEFKPKIAEHAKIVFFDVASFAMQNDGPLTIENNFLDFCKTMQDQVVIFIMNQTSPFFATDPKSPLGSLGKCLKGILSAENWRLIVMSDIETNELTLANGFRDYFSFIHLPQISLDESKNILIHYKTEIENFYKITIPDEVLSSALMLAHFYLSSLSPVDTAYELLESAAARTDNETYLTPTHLLKVVSSWTQIPLSHLQNNKFQANKFIENVQRRVFGQDASLKMIATELQQACIELHDKSAPLCSFLFVGPHGSGKKETTYALVEHLFGHKKALLFVKQNLTVCFNGKFILLIEAVQQIPYAVLLFENIEQNPDSIAALFDIIEQQEDIFRHVIVILTTKLGSDCILELFQQTKEEEPETLDLLELVMNEKAHDAPMSSVARTPQEINDKLIPLLVSHLSKTIIKKLQIIPFIPLDLDAIEKIIRCKIKNVTKKLEENYKIELTTDPEVITFLAQEANSQPQTLDQLLKRHLYTCISHEIISRSEDKNRTHRLSLKLHDNGHMLRCDFISNLQHANMAEFQQQPI